MTEDELNLIEARALAADTGRAWEWNSCDGCMVDTGPLCAWPSEVEWPRYNIHIDAEWWAPEPGTFFDHDAIQDVHVPLSDQAAAVMRHVAGMDPKTTLRLVEEIRRLRSLTS